MKNHIVVLLGVGILSGLLVCPWLVASPASFLSKAVLKFFSKEAAEEGAEKLTKEVGKEVLERVSSRLIHEGGEASVTEAAELAAKHGPDVIRALDGTPAPSKIVAALRQLPAEDVSTAAARLASGERGKRLATATEKLGADVLRAEVMHPGVGMELVRTWPKGGASLGKSLTREEALTLGKYLDDLKNVSPDQREGLLKILQSDKERFFAWLAKFIEANPGKTIGSATFLAVFLPNAEQILGGVQVLYDDKGNPIVVREPGLLEAPVNRIGDSIAQGVLWILSGVAIVITLWLAWRLFFLTRRQAGR